MKQLILLALALLGAASAWWALRDEARDEARRDLYIRGVVLKPSGENVGRAYISGFNPDSGQISGTESGEQGAFALGPLWPGTYDLTVNSLVLHDNTAECTAADFADSDPVTVTAGDEGVVLRLRAGGSLSGRVVNAVSREPLFAEIVIASEDPNPRELGRRDTENDGRFHCSNLEPGAFSIFATAGELAGVLRGVLVSPGENLSDLVVALEPGAVLLVEHEDDEDAWLFDVIYAAGGARTVRGNSPEKEFRYVLPAGRVTVMRARVWGDEGDEDLCPQTVDLVAGEETKVVLSGS